MARILIVDDSAVTRNILEAMTSLLGHEVVGTCDNGQDALTEATRLMPDVMLLDMMMPVMDGLQVLGAIARWTAAPQVIMISSVTDAYRIQAAREAGLRYFVLKPFEFEKVKEVLERCLSERATAAA